MQRVKRLGTVGLLLVAFALPGPALAEGVRVELTGLALVGKNSRNLRQAAMRSGVRDAVIEVAQAVAAMEPDESDASIRRALGSDLMVYAERFRILEDQGERPRVGADGVQTGETVYAVWLEVYVDRERVVRRLREAGLVAVTTPVAPPGRLLLEFQGVKAYANLEVLEGVLRDLPTVGTVVPRAFAAGRVLLEVESREAPNRLLDRLFSRAPEGLLLRRMPGDGSTWVVRVEERP